MRALKLSRFRYLIHFSVILLALAILHWSTAAVNADLQIRTSRWLEVRQVVGSVLYQQGARSAPARVGGRLQSVGEGIITGAASRSVLGVDNGIGFIDVAENTDLRVRQLQQLPDGGHVTRLSVSRGQANLRVRRFTHPSSELEIETPAGWSGVRGTEFGVAVQPDGKTGVATLSGQVIASAQGQNVAVNAGFQSLVIPGEPPSPPVRFSRDARLHLNTLAALEDGNARIVGEIDPVNLLVIEGVPQTTNRIGRFAVTVPFPPTRLILAVVITPLGNRQTYELAVPRR